MSITLNTWQLRTLSACSLSAVVLAMACDQGGRSADSNQMVVENQSVMSTLPPPELSPQFVAQELLQLRDQVDPGWDARGDVFVPLPLTEGSASDVDARVSDRELFAAQVRRLSGDDTDTTPTLTPTSSPTTPDNSSSRWPTALQSMGTVAEQGRIEALREAAYQLDLAAHLLEQHDLTARADELRGLANPLRDDARRLRRRAEMAQKQPGATSIH